MAATPTTLRLANDLRRQLEDVTDQQTRDLVRAWAVAWDEVAPDLQTALQELIEAAGQNRVTRRMLLRSSRLQQALTIVADQLETLAQQAGVRITGDLHGVVDRAGAAQAHIIASQLPRDVRPEDLEGWDRVDSRQLDAIVKRSTEQITSRRWKLSSDAERAVRRELVRGVAAGSNPRATARRMVARAERGFNGGLSRALNIARTETLDAHRAGALLSRQQNADVLAGWSWHCELTERSCPACISMDGQVFPPGTSGPDGHQSCRCTGVPITKPWSELGFEGMQEPESVLVPARDRFEQMPAATQREILGKGRYDAWRRGDYPPDAWAVRRSNSGWRDSVQVSKVPSGGRSSGRLAS